MFGELIQMGTIISAATGIILGLLGKWSTWQKTWNPKMAPIIGSALAVIVVSLNLITPEPTMLEAIEMGAGFGAMAVGAHNDGKRLGSGAEHNA